MKYMILTFGAQNDYEAMAARSATNLQQQRYLHQQAARLRDST